MSGRREKSKAALDSSLIGINYSLKRLEESQKEIANFMLSLVESKAEHKVEIKNIKAAIERSFNDLKQIDSRLDKIEGVITIKNENINKWHSSFFELLRDYWQAIAVIFSIVSFILSYFFGFKIKGDI